jgi:ABC-2 type transport system ATP-binding protein
VNTTLEIKDLNFAYSTNQILEDVSLELNEGECLGLIGSNGCGKTTFLNCILDELKPSGKVIFLGEQMQSSSLKQRKQIGIVPDDDMLLDYLTMEELLRFVGLEYGMSLESCNEQIDYWLEKFDMTENRNRIIKFFSHGMKKKTQIIAGILSSPKLLIIDEPTNGLDVETIYALRGILNELKGKGTAIIICTHILEFAEKTCDRIVILNHKKMSSSISTNELKYGELEKIFLNYIKAGA